MQFDDWGQNFREEHNIVSVNNLIIKEKVKGIAIDNRYDGEGRVSTF